MDEEITERMIKSKLADWYPQIFLDYNLQHYFKLQTAVFAGNTVTIGSENTSFTNLSLTQNVFNRDVLLASRSADDVRKQAKQNTANSKIDLVQMRLPTRDEYCHAFVNLAGDEHHFRISSCKV